MSLAIRFIRQTGTFKRTVFVSTRASLDTAAEMRLHHRASVTAL